MKTSLLILALLAGALYSATLDVEVDGIKPQKGGDIIIAICTPEQKFPCGRASAFKASKTKVIGESAKFTFNLPNGTYAVVVGHDENGNNKVDKNFLGIPTEGYVISGKETLSPDFSEAKFALTDNAKISMKMRY